MKTPSALPPHRPPSTNSRPKPPNPPHHHHHPLNFFLPQRFAFLFRSALPLVPSSDAAHPASYARIAFFYFIVEKTNFLVPKLRLLAKKPSRPSYLFSRPPLLRSAIRENRAFRFHSLAASPVAARSDVGNIASFHLGAGGSQSTANGEANVERVRLSARATETRGGCEHEKKEH